MSARQVRALRKRLRARLSTTGAVAGVVALTASFTPIHRSIMRRADAATTPSPDLSDTEYRCDPIALTGTTYVSPDGKESGDPSAGSATVYHYRLSGESEVRVPVPPKEWNPRTASDNELRAFGWNVPADDNARRDDWASQFDNYRPADPAKAPPLCNYPDIHAVIRYYANWSGIESIGPSNTYSTVDGDYALPHDVFACPSGSSAGW